jgi:hypothetical protein
MTTWEVMAISNYYDDPKEIDACVERQAGSGWEPWHMDQSPMANGLGPPLGVNSLVWAKIWFKRPIEKPPERPSELAPLSDSPIRYRGVLDQFHYLWGKAQGKPDYDEREWMNLERQMLSRF